MLRVKAAAMGSDIATRREDVAMCGDVCGSGRFAETGFIRITGIQNVFSLIVEEFGYCIPSPRMIGSGDSVDVRIGKFAMHSIDKGAEFAGVDEESLLPAVAEISFYARVLAARQKPKADRNLRAVKELAGESDHVVLRFAQDLRSGFAFGDCATAQGSVHEVGLDGGAADVVLASQALRVSSPVLT